MSESPRLMRDYSWCHSTHKKPNRRKDFRLLVAELSASLGTQDAYADAAMSTMEPDEYVVALTAGFEWTWKIWGKDEWGVFLASPDFTWFWIMATDRRLRLGQFLLTEQKVRRSSKLFREFLSERGTSVVPIPKVSESGQSAFDEVNLEYRQFSYVVEPDVNAYEDGQGNRIVYFNKDLALAVGRTRFHPMDIGMVTGWFGAAQKELFFFVEDGSAAEAAKIVEATRP